MRTHILKETRFTTLTRKTVVTAHCGVTCIIIPNKKPRYTVKYKEEALKEPDLCRNCAKLANGDYGRRRPDREGEANL